MVKSWKQWRQKWGRVPGASEDEKEYARDHGITEDDMQCRRIAGHAVVAGKVFDTWAKVGVKGHIFTTDSLAWGYMLGMPRCPERASSVREVIILEEKE